MLLLPTDGPTLVFVIDAKATTAMKIGACVQVAAYSLILRELIRFVLAERREAAGLPPLEMAKSGGIWLLSAAVPQTFAVDAVEKQLTSFLGGTLKEALTAERYDRGGGVQEWHLAKKCLSCPYVASCRSDAVKRGLTQAIDGPNAQQRAELSRWNDRVAPAAGGGTELQRLERAIAADQPDPAMQRSLERALLISYDGATPKGIAGDAIAAAAASQPRDPKPVSPRVDALLTGRPRFGGRPSLTLPRTEEVAVFVTLVEDPARRGVCCGAVRVRTHVGGGGPVAAHAHRRAGEPPSDCWWSTHGRRAPSPTAAVAPPSRSRSSARCSAPSSRKRRRCPGAPPGRAPASSR